MTTAVVRPVAYVAALVVIVAIAFVVGRAWGPDVEPAPQHSPSHSVDGGHR
ncbi:hypothetical protein [Gordonia sp. 'Campus']|jgi:hypothetical protein|uniref:hypothetical protein n=1 Tax=Gordonia sp. 'Campus' TaxID=2915824 RepID=UPI001EE4C47C|nr:hypothetical protein [Gordonia sp. 'Campus']